AASRLTFYGDLSNSASKSKTISWSKRAAMGSVVLALALGSAPPDFCTLSNFRLSAMVMSPHALTPSEYIRSSIKEIAAVRTKERPTPTAFMQTHHHRFSVILPRPGQDVTLASNTACIALATPKEMGNQMAAPGITSKAVFWRQNAGTFGIPMPCRFQRQYELLVRT